MSACLLEKIKWQDQTSLWIVNSTFHLVSGVPDAPHGRSAKWKSSQKIVYFQFLLLSHICVSAFGVCSKNDSIRTPMMYWTPYFGYANVLKWKTDWEPFLDYEGSTTQLLDSNFWLWSQMARSSFYYHSSISQCSLNKNRLLRQWNVIWMMYTFYEIKDTTANIDL